MNYNQAINLIRQRRQAQLVRAENAYMKALDEYPALKDADRRYREAVLHQLHGDSHGDVKKAERQLSDVIASLGLKEVFAPPPHCKKCGDSGYVNGKICDCVLSMATAKDMIAFKLHDFDDIDYGLFTPDAARQFRKTAENYRIIFCDKFPDTKKRIFTLMGKSGTGKTFLASCAASAVLKKGCSVVFVTAFRFVSDACRYHTTFDDTRDGFLRPYLDCDLMIIDDLGTEAVYKNITLEYLYLVINERQLEGKHSIFTTNLHVDAQRARYGERISSRLMDKKTCYATEFDGGDIRSVM